MALNQDDRAVLIPGANYRPDCPADHWYSLSRDACIPKVKAVTAPAVPGVSGPLPGSRKDDTGKLRAGLVLGGFARALSAVAEVGTFGANKYAANGWVSVPNGLERYEDAAERHRLDRRKGILLDPESKLRHRAHEAWNALALLDLELRAEENDAE